MNKKPTLTDLSIEDQEEYALWADSLPFTDWDEEDPNTEWNKNLQTMHIWNDYTIYSHFEDEISKAIYGY